MQPEKGARSAAAAQQRRRAPQQAPQPRRAQGGGGGVAGSGAGADAGAAEVGRGDQPAGSSAVGATRLQLPRADQGRRGADELRLQGGELGHRAQWSTLIRLGSKSVRLGSFSDEEEAARAYDAEARKHYTEETLPQQEHYGGFNFPAGERAAIKDVAAPTSSRFRGVSRNTKSGKFMAALTFGGKRHTLGHYADEEDAARAYDAEARKHYTEETLPRQSTHGGFSMC